MLEEFVFLFYFLYFILIIARSGIIPVVIAIPMYLLFSRKIATFFYSILSVFIIILLWQNVIVKYVPVETLLWVYEFFNEISEGDKGGTVEALQSMRVLPESTMEWILGTGIDAFDDYKGKSTDIGYQLQLFYGGIIYLILLVNLIFQLIKTANKMIPKTYLITVVISLLLLNYKGELIANRMSFTSFVFIMMYYAQLARVNEGKETIGVKNKTIIKTNEQSLQYESN